MQEPVILYEMISKNLMSPDKYETKGCTTALYGPSAMPIWQYCTTLGSQTD